MKSSRSDFNFLGAELVLVSESLPKKKKKKKKKKKRNEKKNEKKESYD
jgi:hypothetical protein